MQPFAQEATQILAPVLLAIVTALAAVAMAAIGHGKTAAIAYFKSKSTANNQAVIDSVAYEAHAWAEKWAATTGQNKLDTAVDYASRELRYRLGIDLPPDKIKAAIQAAWQSYNANK